jgi:hypothetical protein
MLNPRPQNAKRFLSEADQVAKQAAQRRTSRGFNSPPSPPKEDCCIIKCSSLSFMPKSAGNALKNGLFPTLFLYLSKLAAN